MPKGLVEVIIRAKDMTSTALSSFQRRFAAAGKVISTVAKGVAAFTAAVAAAIYGLTKLGEQGAKVIGVKLAFARTTDDETAALQRLREASGGTISDLDLMARHNQALALGTARSTEEFARMLRVSDALGDSLGIDGVTAMEKFADVMASGSQRAARALGIEIKAGATRNEILAAGEAVARRIAGNMDEGAESAERFSTAVSNTKDRISKLVAQSPVVSWFFELLTDLVNKAASAFERLLRWVLRVPEGAGVGAGGAGDGGGGVGVGAAPLDDIPAVARRNMDFISPEALARYHANRRNPINRSATRMYQDMRESVGVGAGVWNETGEAGLELANAADVVVDSMGRMADAAVSESGRMSDAIIGSLQNVIANIKMKQGGVFGATLFGGILGVGLGLVGGMLSRRGREPVPVALHDVSDRAAQQMRDKGGPPIRVTTIIEQGGIEIERIERELYDRQQRDEVVRYSPRTGLPLMGR